MRRRHLFALTIVAAAIFGSTAQAATYYVSPSGSDGNTGTSSVTPWRTVAHVNGVSFAPGDSVLFEGSQAFSDASLMPATSGTASAPITFGSYGTGRAKLLHAATVWLGAGEHGLVFQDLDLSAGGAASGIFTSAGSGTGVYDIVLQRSYLHDTAAEGIDSPQHADHDWRIEDNTISHIGDSGMILWGANDVVRGNTISDTGWNTSITSGKHGIYSKGADMTIADNDLSRNQSGQAVSIRMHGARVYGNSIHDTGYALAFFDYDPAPAPQGTSYIYNNRLWNISGWGFYYDGQLDPNGHVPTVDFVVASNTFSFASASEAVNVSPSGSARVTLANNVFMGSYGSALRAASKTVEKNNLWVGGTSNIPSGTGDLRLDPALSAPSALAPSALSPVVNRGTASVNGLPYSAACDGQSLHYCGSAPEIGGVEYLSPTSGSTGPSAPAGLAITTSGLNSVSLTWLPSTDDVGVAGYDVYANGVKMGTTAVSTATVAGLTCSTSYTMGVQAFDADGNRSSLVTVPGTTQTCVSAPVGADTTPPNVTITSPGSGAGVGKTFTVSAGAVDASGIAELRFFLNGVLVCVVSGPSGSCSMASKSGTNTVTVQARDNAGNVGIATLRVKAARGGTYSVTKQLRAHLQTGRYRLRRP